MRTDFTVSLNNVNLHELDSSIFIEDITEQPSIEVQTEGRGSYGLAVTNAPEREKLDIVIQLMIKQANRVTRQQVITKIKGWAKKGWLRTNIRPNQRIYVQCTKPIEHKSLKTCESMEITFTAFYESFWQDNTPTSVTITGSSGSASITPNGTRNCFLEAEITNTSGSTVTSVTLSARSQTLQFQGLSMANNAKLTISYDDERHVFMAKVGSTSVLGKRTEASSDDIILPNGTSTTVSFSASGACSAVIKARGLYD